MHNVVYSTLYYYFI